MATNGWKVPKLWKGSTCYILGGGPSWLHQFNIPKAVIDKVCKGKQHMSLYSPYLKYLHNKHTIAVNGAFQLGSWLSVCAFMDLLWFEQYERQLLTQFAGLRVTTNDTVMQLPYAKGNIQYIAQERNKMYGISSRDGCCANNGNSGAFAINVAYHLGVSKIYLLGFDMDIVKGTSHFHSEYKDIWTKQIVAVHLRCFADIAKDAKRLGIEIINVNPDSGITDFPKMTLEEVIRSETK